MFRILKITTHREPKFEQHPEIGNVGKRKARYQSVMRVLKPNTIYDFYNQERSLPENFFSEGLPHISISAIVGENGMGKSSLLELMLRIVNNAAYAMRGGLDKRSSYHPRYVRDVYATLTFEDMNDRGRQRKHEIVIDDKIIRFLLMAKQNGHMISTIVMATIMVLLIFKKGLVLGIAWSNYSIRWQ